MADMASKFDLLEELQNKGIDAEIIKVCHILVLIDYFHEFILNRSIVDQNQQGSQGNFQVAVGSSG